MDSWELDHHEQWILHLYFVSRGQPRTFIDGVVSLLPLDFGLAFLVLVPRGPVVAPVDGDHLVLLVLVVVHLGGLRQLPVRPGGGRAFLRRPRHAVGRLVLRVLPRLGLHETLVVAVAGSDNNEHGRCCRTRNNGSEKEVIRFLFIILFVLKRSSSNYSQHPSLVCRSWISYIMAMGIKIRDRPENRLEFFFKLCLITIIRVLNRWRMVQLLQPVLEEVRVSLLVLPHAGVHGELLLTRVQ